MLHTIKTQNDCDDVVVALRQSNKQSNKHSHIIFIYAHGSEREDQRDVLETINGDEYIFIDDLALAIRDVMAMGNDVYLIANSCYWNIKYKWGFPTPTISFGPDDSTRLPFRSECIEESLAELPDQLDKSHFLNWARDLQAKYKYHANLWYVRDANNEKIEVKEFRIIEAVMPAEGVNGILPSLSPVAKKTIAVKATSQQ